MDDFLNRGKGPRKTASQIIAEAKASIGPQESKKGPPSTGSGGGPFQRRVLSTKRPFTPRCAERTRPLSAHRHGALMVVEESDDDACITNVKLTSIAQDSSNSKKADLLQRSSSACSARLPALVPPIGSQRQQFRPLTAVGVKETRAVERSDNDPLAHLISMLQASQDDVSTATALESLITMEADLSPHRKQLIGILSRHVASDNFRILFPLAEAFLLLTQEKGSRTLLVLASKIIFKLSRDDSNDNLFLTRRTMDLLLTSLGQHCPRREHEAFVYAYGSLKFLSLNGKIATYLSETLGFLHLCMLHIKLLCEEAISSSSSEAGGVGANGKKSSSSQVMFQITSCLRNLCNLADNCEKFITQLDGLKTILQLIEKFPKDIDVMCNVSRLLSVLTASYEEFFEDLRSQEELVDALFVILSRHHNRRDIVVRITFVMGNLAAHSREARSNVGLHAETVALLPLLLRRYLSDTVREGRDIVNPDEAALDFGSTGNSEDTAVKIIRVFANASIEPDTVVLIPPMTSIFN
jgi:hypothetical protein